MKSTLCMDRLLRAGSVLLAAVLLALCLGGMPLRAKAATADELQQQLAALEEKLNADKAALAEMKENTAEAKAAKKLLEDKIATLKSQINLLTTSIANVNSEITTTTEQINETMAAIEVKKQEIEDKQAEIDRQWGDFKTRVSAMQEMKDCGTMSLLSAVDNLYQLLTFSQVLQDISEKDTEILDDMKRQKEELNQAKAELEAQQATLEEQKAELEKKKQQLKDQQSQLKNKQTELAGDLVTASNNLTSAQEAQAEAQATVDSDQMDYEAVKGQIQSLISGSQSSYADLSFTGFRCPLNSYTRISSTFGYRTIFGKTSYHAGLDFAAPAGTPIYAAASGYVTASTMHASGYGNYVLIYHGAMNDGNTYSTLYGHMTSRAVSVGQYVAQGDIIGYVGSTGRSTGNHLHLEVWQGASVGNSIANKAQRVDPASYVPTR